MIFTAAEETAFGLYIPYIIAGVEFLCICLSFRAIFTAAYCEFNSQTVISFQQPLLHENKQDCCQCPSQIILLHSPRYLSCFPEYVIMFAVVDIHSATTSVPKFNLLFMVVVVCTTSTYFIVKYCQARVILQLIVVSISYTIQFILFAIFSSAPTLGHSILLVL